MAKKIKEEKTEVTETKVETISFDNKAYSIVSHGDKKYSLYEVTFNAENSVPGLVKIVKSNVDYYEAKDAFKRAVIESGMFNIN